MMIVEGWPQGLVVEAVGTEHGLFYGGRGCKEGVVKELLGVGKGGGEKELEAIGVV